MIRSTLPGANMMLTPEGSEGVSRSRLHEEVTPNHTPTSPQRGQHTPGKTSQYASLHFNSQQYRTPSSHPHHLQLKHHMSSPLCGTPPDAPMTRVRVTPRAAPRNMRQWSTPSSAGSAGSSGYRVNGTPGRSLIRTPNGILYNPFETDPEKMKEWILSPGMFAPKSGGEEVSSPFWSIDHIAMMQPADIDETCLQNAKLLGSVDPETEERAQNAIDQFFANNAMILPSPWSEQSSHKRPFQLPQTPVTPGITQMVHSSASSPSAKNISSPKAKEGKYYTHEAKEEGSPDPLSTSSLRRKLFFHGEESNPPSPVPDTEPHDQGHPMEDESMSGANLSLTPQSSKRSSHHTPNSNLFSSSPIHSDSDRGSQTPSLRRCSTAPELMASPSLSPIGASQRGKQRRSLSKEEGFTSDSTPLCQPLHHTPSSGRPSLPFSSPGVSPIRQEGCRSSTIRDHSGGKGSSSSVPSSTPSPVCQLNPLTQVSKEEPQSNDPASHKDMEVDRDFSFTKETDAFASSAGFQILRGFTGFSDSVGDQSAADDHQLHPAHSTHVAQDTGYQTNSLQSMNQDTGLHTNLTNQFGSLPLSSRDTGLEEDYNNTSSMDVCLTDRTHLFSSTRLPHPTNPDDESARDSDFKLSLVKQNAKIVSSANNSSTNVSGSKLDESLILRQARKALGKPEDYVKEEPKNMRDLQKSDSGTGIDVFASEIQSHWSVTVPTPLRQKLHQVGLIDKRSASGEKDLMPSSVALKAIKRAGQDYDLYCQPQVSKSHLRRPSVITKEILKPDVEDERYLEFEEASLLQTS